METREIFHGKSCSLNIPFTLLLFLSQSGQKSWKQGHVHGIEQPRKSDIEEAIRDMIEGIINSRPLEGSQRLEALRSWANCYVRKIPDLKWFGTINKAPYPHFPDDVI